VLRGAAQPAEAPLSVPRRRSVGRARARVRRAGVRGVGGRRGRLTTLARSVRTPLVETRLNPADCTLYSRAANGSEAAVGEAAERRGVEEVTCPFEGHNDARSRGLRVLTNAALRPGAVSLSYVRKLMHGRYPDTPLFRKVLQSIWHQVNN